jgi:hydrogenase maturation protease
MKTLILGIGNLILGDDGVGVRVAQELAKKISDEDTRVIDIGVDGLNLLELMVGYDRLIVIDAIMTDEREVGTVHRLKPEQIYAASGLSISPHHFNLPTTIEIGKRLFPNEMPKEVILYTVGTQEVAEVTEEMTDKVKEAIPKVVNFVLGEIDSASVK